MLLIATILLGIVLAPLSLAHPSPTSKWRVSLVEWAQRRVG